MLSSIVLSAALASMVASASKFDDRVGYRRATPESMLFKRQAAQLNLPAGVDLGSCTDPTMIFAQGLEGRTETTFQPNNLDEFNHGAAQNQVRSLLPIRCSDWRSLTHSLALVFSTDRTSSRNSSATPLSTTVEVSCVCLECFSKAVI